MDEETKKLLAENLSLNKENHEMLKKLMFYQKMNQIYKIIYWFVIIGVTFGAFYFIQPMLSNLLNVYTGGVSGLNDVNLKSNQGSVQDLLKQLNN